MRSNRPKVLFEVGGAPMLEWPIRRARAVGAAPVVVVVGHEAASVEAAVRTRFAEGVAFAEQTERLGTGHAAKVGMGPLEGFEGKVLILYGDVPLLEAESLQRLLDLVTPERPVALISTELDNPTGYGRIVRDEAGNVVAVVEHKDASEAQREIREVNAGIYAVEASFLRSALGRIGNANAQKEYYLTDIVDLAVGDARAVSGLIVEPAQVQGANDRAQLAELERLANRRTIHRHLVAGVTFLDPERTTVEAHVEIGPDAVIHAGVHLRGQTRVGAGAVIDVGCVLTDAEVGPRSVVHPYSVLESARVAEACSVGPFARLRPEAVLEDGAKVGNFVEVKKATLGLGAKVNHLSYIGDAEVGAGANVGAGTITCNYDGVGKHQTKIGEKVFVGSNSTLVAPLELGEGTYVAAGSVVTRSVPEGALALGRSRQVNKEGRAEMIRQAAEAKKRAKKG